MKQSFDRNKKMTEKFSITYYCTLFFSILGTLLVSYVLYAKLDLQNWFTLLLAITAGGLPIGLVGAYLDYKLAVYRWRRVQQQEQSGA